MQLTGTIKEIGETQSFGNKGFKRRDVVLTTDEKYPQNITVEFHQEKTDELNSFNQGDNVDIFINILGKEYTDKNGQLRRFNSIKGWRIDRKEAGASSGVSTAQHSPDREDEDLPF